MYYCSWWAEAAGGTLVRRLKSKKNPAISMMRDWQRHEYVSRERILHPDLFPDTKKQIHLQAITTGEPTYLSHELEPNVVLMVKDIKRNESLSARAHEELRRFVSDNALTLSREERKNGVLYYESLEVNGIHIRTGQSERGIKTRDSIVGGRYWHDEKSREVFIFGSVLHILQYGSETLIYGKWFRNISRRISDDQRAGLAIIPVTNRTNDTALNGWINVNDLLMQHHILVGNMMDRVFHIVIKI